VHLPDDVREKGEIGVVVGGEVPDDDVARLAVSIEAAIALLEARGVPGDVEVQQEARGLLKIEPLRGRIGRDEHTHGIGGIVERRLYRFALGLVHPAE
jgi:hypothetical protein